MLNMKDGAILANAGHFNVEIDMAGLEKACIAKKEMRENIMGYQLANGKWVNVIAEGRLANIAAADGHPAEIMDMSFAVQALSALYVRNNKDRLENKVIYVTDGDRSSGGLPPSGSMGHYYRPSDRRAGILPEQLECLSGGLKNSETLQPRALIEIPGEFAPALLQWYGENAGILPWRDDPAL